MLVFISIATIGLIGGAPEAAVTSTLVPNLANAEPHEIDWNLLAQLDYKTGIPSKVLGALDGAKVKIPGFIVPLDDEFSKITQFLLVPSPQACIHVPAPPPNQMVLVHMSADKGAEFTPAPVWIEGILQLNAKDSVYGKASFSMEATAISRYSQ